MTPPEPQFEVYMSRRVPLRRQRWYWRLRTVKIVRVEGPA